MKKLNFEMLLSKINNKNYYYVCYEQLGNESDAVWSIGFNEFYRDELYDGDLVDCFYDVLFDNELKDKFNNKFKDFNEWQAYDRKNNSNEHGVGKNEILLAKKIVKIICECNLVYLNDKRNKLNDLIDLKYVNMLKENKLEHEHMIKRMLFYNKM